MRHGISDLEWNDYLDGRAQAAVCDRIEAHLIGCLECWDFYQQMSCAAQELLEAAHEARQCLTVEDRRLHTMVRGTFSRLRAEGAVFAVPSQVQGRLNMLETVLAPFCGAQAAAHALQMAARNSPARSLDQVTVDNWRPFLENVAVLAGAMCGETFAGLVLESGQF